jgi:hypothetical protein
MARTVFFFFFLLSILYPSFLCGQQKSKTDRGVSYNFKANEFRYPALNYAPLTRWWWPGNDVTREELLREVNIFADNHFGGVEIQPFAMVMPAKGKGRSERITSFDTPAYYDNLRNVLEEAKKRGLIVDMNNGSGWPAGGANISEKETFLSLEYGMVDLIIGQENNILPRPQHGDGPNAQLVALLVAKLTKSASADNSICSLNPEAIIDITTHVNDSTFMYSPPAEGYKAIAIWSVSVKEKPVLIASKNGGLVANHFDSLAIKNNLQHYFGERTGLTGYYGNPIRAIFDDSYEFKVNRHFSDDFIATFEKNRGYDIRPYLPANIWYGYDNLTYRLSNQEQKPEFTFGEELDWRFRYDYDLTLSELLENHFLSASGNWLHQQGLLHRTQTYGFKMDNMAMAGIADIPECETMQFSKNTEGGLKIISSGAHLYNKPLVSCESSVYLGRGGMTTPQKLKLTLDKVFSCGINHVVWHGTAYQYYPPDYPEEGWYPFINAFVGVNFSTNLNESNPFWKYIKDINTYAQRAQYVLRSGKPQADVLIFYPFLSYSPYTENPNEIFIKGVMPEVEPPLPESVTSESSYSPDVNTDWLNAIWPLINELNTRGIIWDWVNDVSVREIKVKDRQLDIRGNNYQSLILFKLPYMQLKTAEHVKAISEKGANVLVFGEPAHRQPGFNNYKENDALIARTMLETITIPSVTHVSQLNEVNNWLSSIHLPLVNGQKYSFIRQTRRVMDNGNVAQFIWNTSDNWQNIEIVADEDFKYAAWFNAEDGSIQNAKIYKQKVQYEIPPLSTIFLYASIDPIIASEGSEPTIFNPASSNRILTIDKWNLNCDTIMVKDTKLFDWKNNKQMMYAIKEGVYSSTFIIDKIDKKSSYILDLGKTYFSADLTINDKKVGTRLFTPFCFYITDYLQKGENRVEVIVTPTLLNGNIGRGKAGLKEYKNYKDQLLMSQGLIGPVVLYKR